MTQKENIVLLHKRICNNCQTMPNCEDCLYLADALKGRTEPLLHYGEVDRGH